MSGHSKWSTIKRKKAKVDAQRGKLFTRLSREIIVAARLGGGDPDANPRLKAAIQRAKEANIPNENIQRAIQKGTGELGAANYEELIYEGYGPGGVAVMMEIMTDNRNRTAGEIRHLFSRHGGNLGEAGCVSWMFSKKGVIVVEKDGLDEDELMLTALEAGAEDMKTEEDEFEIITAPEDFEKVRQALVEKGIPIAEAQVTMVPQSTVKLTGQEAEQMVRLMEALEDHDDVQEVYANFELEDY
ncbi:YebC/PmpR family DNA-binding transcriptional regulator [Desulfofundulus thermosubterraneus]|uniref:Probable transcriptional regulatory protein SAMN02745219_01919 n=1 Tax=Desulfofundulus thermosubterraneus DSM 16057 TaxID=1121432 RepID=A0A1M6H737_9FIRM|nr:YebC/PmpR family DNA-binding transcriptional regulator [Desulfofundulus thermosubterraneus]SHJ17919.1 DNA-binding regulatory protein, YebC/PmpR family [Desulfofundulus thermosubterraneus DSM 16057]